MDFKNILTTLGEITETAPIENPKVSPPTTKEVLNESAPVATSRAYTGPSLKDVFTDLMEADISLEPVQSGAQTIKSDGEAVGVAHTPQAATQMKASLENGEITFNGDSDTGMNEDCTDEQIQEAEDWIDGAVKKPGAFRAQAENAGMSTAAFAKYVLAHKDKFNAKTEKRANLAKTFSKMASEGDGSGSTGGQSPLTYVESKSPKLPSLSRVKSMCNEGLTVSSILQLHSRCNQKELKTMINKTKTQLKEGADHILKAAKHMGKSHGLCKGGYSCPHDEGSEGHRAYHEGYVEGLDECMGIRNEPVVGLVKEEPPIVDTMASYGAMGEAETSPDGNVGADDSGAYDKYDWNAETVARKGIAEEDDAWTFESFESDLDALLNEDKVDEGVTISITQGEGEEDRVSVNATDAEADSLLKFVKDVGLGNYGDAEVEADAIEPGEVSFYGSPDAPAEEMGSHDDMLKLMGIMDLGDEIEDPATGTEYDTNDFEDEVDVEVIDGDTEECCEGCGNKLSEGCGCDKTDEGANMAAQYGPDSGADNSSNDEKGNAAANAALASNDADTPQLVKEKESGVEIDANDVKPESDDMHEDQGYNDEEDESLGMRDGRASHKDDNYHSRRDQSRGDYGNRDAGSIMKEMLNMLSEVGAESSEEPEQPLSQHDDPGLLTAESAEDAPADDLQGDTEELAETETDDQREFKVAEGKLPAGLQAYQDKKNGKKDDSAEEETDEDKEVDEDKEEELNEWANDAGKNGTETSFEQDIDFMTNVISGGLNKQKSTGQATVPVIADQKDRTGYNGSDLVKEGSIMSHDGLAGLMLKMDELSK